MNGLKVFENPEFGQVRTVTKDNDPFFVWRMCARL